MSKLPKPSGIKKPMTVISKPETLAPTRSLTNLMKETIKAGLTAPQRVAISRRSKSYTDLRRPLRPPNNLNDGILKPSTSKTDLTSFKRAAPLLKQAVKRPFPTIPERVEVKPKVPKPNPEKKPVEETKPVVRKAKPAQYDYKARFQLLQEKHTDLVAKYNEQKLKLASTQNELDELLSNNSQLSNQCTHLEKENRLLCNERHELKRELDKVKPALEITTKELNEIREQYDEIIVEVEKLRSETKILNHSENKLKSENENLNSDLKYNVGLVAQYKEQIYKSDNERRKMHNTIQDLKGNIRVFCRIRPPLPYEQDRILYDINFADDKTIELSKLQNDSTGRQKIAKHDFSFDQVFPPTSTQDEVFQELSQLVQSAIDGYNVCVFAYGQTGSGKTYTMEGGCSDDTLGMIPRTVRLLFDSFEYMKQFGWSFTVKTSFLEIYNERIIDLLDANKRHQEHEIRMADARGSDIFVTNLTVEPINSAAELIKFMNRAQKNRAVAATENNDRSSRSHSVTKIELEGINAEKKAVTKGNLNLVDLAGSEKVQSVGTNRLTETKNINRSLAEISNVILALLQKHEHVPYRNSKLTHLLKPSLGGNSKTLMLVNISPFDDCFNESLNSLRFASKVNQCKTGTIKRNKTSLHS